MLKNYTFRLMFVLVAALFLSSCSEDKWDAKKGGTNKEIAKEVQQTFFLYKETGQTEDQTGIGDLYVKTLTSDIDKISSNVMNGQYVHNRDDDSVLFLTGDHELYEYKKGADKEKIASDVLHFSSQYSNKYIFIRIMTRIYISLMQGANQKKLLRPSI